MCNIPKWQGNSLTGYMTDAEHVVFVPSGELLQKVCMVRTNSKDSKRQCVSNFVECAAVVRQLELLGPREMYATCPVRVAARGGTNCVILSDTSNEEELHLEKIHTITFKDRLHHISGSPHCEDDIAFVTSSGELQWWDPNSGLQSMGTCPTDVSVNDRLLHCEYSHHPCLLWTSSRSTVQTVDLRLRASPVAMPTLFDLSAVNGGITDIYAIKRRTRYD